MDAPRRRQLLAPTEAKDAPTQRQLLDEVGRKARAKLSEALPAVVESGGAGHSEGGLLG